MTSRKRETAVRLASASKQADLTPAEMLDAYRIALLARRLDERLVILNRAGRLPFVVSGMGHEVAQVGVIRAVRRGTDLVIPYYRSIAACLAFGMSPRAILLAQYAKATDPSSAGRQMPGFYSSPELGLVTNSPPVGTQVLHACGLALAARLRGIDQVSMVFLGDGARAQGDVHEGMNFAAVHCLPVVIIIENNGYAISVPTDRQYRIASLADRGPAYGMPGVAIDGTDLRASYRAASAAVERARSGGGPTLIEVNVPRLTAHSSDDQETRYRTEEELAATRARDPLPRLASELRAASVLTDAVAEELETAAMAAVDDATEHAEGAPDPAPSSAMDWVFAERWPSEPNPEWDPRPVG